MMRKFINGIRWNTFVTTLKCTWPLFTLSFLPAFSSCCYQGHHVFDTRLRPRSLPHGTGALIPRWRVLDKPGGLLIETFDDLQIADTTTSNFAYQTVINEVLPVLIPEKVAAPLIGLWGDRVKVVSIFDAIGGASLARCTESLPSPFANCAHPQHTTRHEQIRSSVRYAELRCMSSK